MDTALTLPVSGMTCSGCENAVVRAVGRMSGVAGVAVSHADATVTVAFDPTVVTQAEIEKKIAVLG
nr:heavy-metal-associated domain-containing protein [Acidobacteriota bacterium]